VDASLFSERSWPGVAALVVGRQHASQIQINERNEMKAKILVTQTARILAVSISVCASSQLLAQGSSGCAPKPAGLLSWWRAEGDAQDSVGTNHGTLYGAVGFGPGKVGQAFIFDGSSHVRIADAPNLNFDATSPITIELWAYRVGTASIMHLMGKRDGCGADTGNYQMAFNMNNPGEGLSFGGGASTPGYVVETGLDIPVTNWVYLAGTFDGSTFRFYTNGILAASAAGTMGPINGAALLIGDSGAEGGCMPFVGLIDEVAIYNRALSDAEILGIYNAGSSGKCVQDGPHLSVEFYAGITIEGSVGTTNQIEYVTNLGDTNWIVLTNLVLPQSPYLLFDAGSPRTQRRFYRAVQIP
jgi:hypothetical protein